MHQTEVKHIHRVKSSDRDSNPPCHRCRAKRFTTPTPYTWRFRLCFGNRWKTVFALMAVFPGIENAICKKSLVYSQNDASVSGLFWAAGSCEIRLPGLQTWFQLINFLFRHRALWRVVLFDFPVIGVLVRLRIPYFWAELLFGGKPYTHLSFTKVERSSSSHSGWKLCVFTNLPGASAG